MRLGRVVFGEGAVGLSGVWCGKGKVSHGAGTVKYRLGKVM